MIIFVAFFCQIQWCFIICMCDLQITFILKRLRQRRIRFEGSRSCVRWVCWLAVKLWLMTNKVNEVSHIFGCHFSFSWLSWSIISSLQNKLGSGFMIPEYFLTLICGSVLSVKSVVHSGELKWQPLHDLDSSVDVDNRRFVLVLISICVSICMCMFKFVTT